MVTINPADCPPDRVYMGIVNGRREVMCRFPHRELPWETFANVHADDSVSDLVPLVEARPITRDEQGEMWARIRDELRKHYGAVTDADHRLLDLAASASADAAVEYLNDRGGLGIDTREPLERALRERDSFRCDLDWARGKCDELRSLIEGQKANVTEAQRERDAAIERVTRRDGQIDQIARQRDDARAEVETARLERDAAFENYKRIKRERDAAVERAEQAEARVREVESRPWTVALDDKASPVFMPAVTRDEIATVLERTDSDTSHGDEVTYTDMADAVLALLSGSDPAVYVVRESEVAAVPLKHDRNGWDVGQTWYPPLSRGEVKDLLAKEKRAMVRTLAIARAIGVEAEQAVDPVEAKARELWEVARFEDSDEWSGLLQVERDCYRRMAAHVLGQEASSDE